MASKTQVYQQFVKLFESAPIKKITGMTLSYNEEGRAVFVMPRNPDFDHALHDTHGGLIATLIDNAGWFTAAAHYEKWVVTTDLNIRLLEAVKQTDLTATGRLLRAGKNFSVAEMEVQSKDGRLVAVGSGSFMVTSKAIEV
ncbi:MAG: PaaI family thioesterase [Deltaproteobacteria bacterium]|nr:PaaI family thioesterase [Deltaproteobacteria bacterium]MBI4411309.1 PaaI family thioesterase [Deltaproteobacteria bacterium]